jgi:hypothetical protein
MQSLNNFEEHSPIHIEKYQTLPCRKSIIIPDLVINQVTAAPLAPDLKHSSLLAKSKPFYTKQPSSVTVTRSLIAENQILNINCMNCQELVPIENIESHSIYCTSVPENIKLICSNSYIEEVLFKIKKLYSCLEILHKNSDLRPGDKNYISIYLRLSQKLLDETSIQEIESVLKSLSSLILSFKGSFSVGIYAERLQNLAREQKIAVQEKEIENQKESIQKIKDQLEKYKNRSNILEKSLINTTPPNKITKIKKKIDAISSDIGTIHSVTTDKTSEIGEFKEELEEPFDIDLGDLKKHFYSLCLSSKLKSSNKKFNKVSIQQLYSDAIDQNVPPDSWGGFIDKEFNNPLRWTQPSKPRNRYSTKPGLKQYFEVIVEEEN